MAVIKVQVIQHYRTSRTCIIEVEAEDAKQALGMLDDGEIDIPPYEDPRWQTSQHEITSEQYQVVR